MTNLNLDETREWLEIVYSEAPGLINICGTREWSGRSFQAGDIDSALAYIQDLDQRKQPSEDGSSLVPREGIYLRATTLRRAPEQGQRGGDDLSFYLPGLWGDIDIAGPGHKTKNTLPPNAVEAMKIVYAAGLPHPSHWIHSGGGLYPWWLLQGPHEIEDLEYVRALSSGWQHALRRGAEKLGYHYGSGIGDLSRVLRIPGTVNRKEGLERPCTMLQGYAWNGPLYEIHELAEALTAVTPEPAPAPTPIQIKMGQSAGEKPGEEFNRTADWRDILIPYGWEWIRKQGDTWYLRRPGKVGGHSATIRDSTDRLWVFSEEAHPFEGFKLYDKFAAYTILEHGGDFRAAARALGARGYGRQNPMVVAAVPGPAQPVAQSMVPVPVPPTATEHQTPPPAGASRPMTRNQVVVNGDRHFVLRDLTRELKNWWNEDRLFNFGGILCERDGLTMRPLSKGALDAITVDTCELVDRKYDGRRKEGERERFEPALAEARVLDMILARPKEFSTLDKLSEVPFVRPDGTICATSGYDAATKTFLELDPVLADVSIPAEPTREQVAWAKSMLMDELLGDFPLHTQADKANALATLITPFVRDLIPTSPLAIIDAKEAGSGKNLLADVMSILTTGKSAQTLPYTTDNDEQRKVITSAFRSGVPMLLFDEAHEIEGAAFARALTSHSYQDRILGGSNLAEFPNNRTWVSLGNQVQIKGDMSRRVYRVRLEYQGTRPESRDASEFRHPDLRQWTLDNRRNLVIAALILVRAWFALDKPQAKLPFRMGSFERWQEILAGILWVGGVEGFLENVPQWRSESDFERQHTVSHLEWLAAQYGDSTFTSAQVTEALKRDRMAEHPPGMEDPFPEGYARKLGQWYARQKDRELDGVKIVKLSEQAHKSVIKWKIVTTREEPDDPGT